MKALNIIACVKKIPDPEAPPKAVNVDRELKKVSFTGVAPVINPFDENALEAALRLKEACGGHITVLSMDEKNARPVLSKVLAVGADRLIILDDEHFRDLDSLSIAYVLSRAVLKIGEWDLIITGRQAGDWDSGQTGGLIAELLQAPVVTLARSVMIEDGSIIVERVKPDGYEKVRARLPALITTSNEVGELRYTSVKQLMEARKMPCEFWSADDIEIDLQALKKMQIVDMYKPVLQKQCVFVDGGSPQEKGKNLAELLVKDDVIATRS
jgi:electron transfer flavoprotein beta subunit